MHRRCSPGMGLDKVKAYGMHLQDEYSIYEEAATFLGQESVSLFGNEYVKKNND